MLREIRVASKQELEDHIHLYFDEVNADPIVFHWSYKLDELPSFAGWHHLLDVYFLFVILALMNTSIGLVESGSDYNRLENRIREHAW